MRKLVIITVGFVVAAVVSCNSKKTADFEAANAAKGYYDQLVRQQCDSFVSGMNLPERIPESYREQLVLNAQMFIEEQNEEHNGLREVRVVNCVNDSAATTAHAFLLLCYGDSTIEEIVVPMVKRDDKWYMK